MTKEEFMAMPANEAAEKLNELVKAGKSKDEAMAEFGVAWGGYTSTKRTGNEAGDTGIGVGDSDPSKGYKGV